MFYDEGVFYEYLLFKFYYYLVRNNILLNILKKGWFMGLLIKIIINLLMYIFGLL